MAALSVCYVGDSDIVKWPLPSTITKIGKDGVTSVSLLPVLSKFQSTLTEKCCTTDFDSVVMTIGENDLSNPSSLECVAQNIEILLSTAPLQRCSRVLFLGPKLEPWMCSDPLSPDLSAMRSHARLSQIISSTLSQFPHVTFVDCLALFTDSPSATHDEVLCSLLEDTHPEARADQLKYVPDVSFFTADMLHLSSEGYRIWDSIVFNWRNNVPAFFANRIPATYDETVAKLYKSIAKTPSQTEEDRQNTTNYMRRCLSFLDISTENMSVDTPSAFKNIIHITGTKGKGSTACFVESILRSCGLRTALYTSPHLVTPRERIRIDGLPVSEEEFRRGLGYVMSVMEENNEQVGYFRLLTLAALYIFKHHKFPDPSDEINVMILEVGIGGIYDATNLFSTSVATAVTRLDLDHVRILGNTLEKIASEKAGIFRSDNRGCFTVNQNDEAAMEILRKKSSGKIVTVEIEGSEADTPDLGLKGMFQRENAAIAVALAKTVLPPSTSPTCIGTGLCLARWPGRCQTLQFPHSSIFAYLDGAHTTKSISVCADWFKTEMSSPQRSGEDACLIFNCSHERDPIDLLKTLADKLGPSNFKSIYFAKSNSERPSSIPVPSVADLLAGTDVASNEAKSQISVGANAGADAETKAHNGSSCDSKTDTNPNWQKTLSLLYPALYPQTTSKTYSFPSVKEVIAHINSETLKGDRTNILCTGSLLLVGSLLEGVNFEERTPEGNILF